MSESETRAVLSEAEDGERRAYNTAFWRLGLRWEWDPATYRELARLPGERERIRAYVERHQPHLLKAYDLDFLCRIIRDSRERAGEASAFSVNSATLA